MYSYFLRRCIPCQTATVCDVLNRTKNAVIDGPPPFWIQMCSSCLKHMQIPWMSCHGGNLKLWHDIVHFFVCWGFIKISPNNRSTGILTIRHQPWTLPQQWWIHHIFITRAHVNHPIFIAQHPQNTWIRQGDKHSLHFLLFIKNCPLCKYLDSSNLARMTARLSCLSMHVPHEHVTKAMRMCRGKRVSQKW
jgi:hypothetical protein